ncbi:MAG: DUF1330 domain-containing protein [Methylobacteriaceae bacterium]|nr:DUF1330 domain-containing protein [Methylobacteriaceae bacterium]
MNITLRRSPIAAVLAGLAMGGAQAAGPDHRTAASENAVLSDDAPVYFVIHQHVTDEKRFDAYVAAVTPLIAKRGATLVAAGTPETIEGDSRFERTVIFLWPSAKVFRAFWASPDYAEVHKLRTGAAEWNAELVPALPAAAP